MKLKYEFAVREIVGEYVMVPLGEGALAFSGMISTSEAGALLVEALKQDVSRDALLELLMQTYDVDAAEAAEDLDTFLNQLNQLKLLEGI